MGDATFSFAVGDRIHTEDATKYDRGELEGLDVGELTRLLEQGVAVHGLHRVLVLELSHEQFEEQVGAHLGQPTVRVGVHE